MTYPLTPRELEIVAVLWELGDGTVAEVRDRLPDDLAYTTVLSLMRTMVAKGYLRAVPEGRAYRFHPRIKREAVQRGALATLVGSLFGGSAELVIANLVSDRTLSRADLRKVRRLIDERLREEDK
ncbi:MAG TPA: BlaI/MecI/CopY family transcriptional regulator [Gemmatimonadaceae bacterium]|nr:BlaI/MecI/CopY family transcriptional regulator [Gemmatimonadaceae bacterium]